ncbi:polymorphic toxin-type HINT domain-containing protein [Streptomyces sp. NBC_01321]|uniref:polymorphic toxin-type HINT domain-containing protein n=1 Tax=Streptomyces sp. NBC_01321 TaxID=2903825 RepID=UPI002E13F673|nr:polymorphic toxin-type HINT domain-containing protein [Streptomyces sp. NBC_01321]
MTESQRRRRRHGRVATVLLLSSTLTVTSLGAEAWAIPGPGMSRERSITEVDLPDLPESTSIDGDEEAEKSLTTAPEVPVDPYAPTAVTPWTENSGTATLTPDAKPGTTVPVSNSLPVALGVPDGTDPASIAGEWKVDLAAPAASQDAGVSGLIMQVTPPATAEPAAQVALTVDTTGFADLYGPQAADRFGLVLLPECVLTSPDSGDCAADGGVQTMSGGADHDRAERLRSTVEVVPANKAPTKSTAAKNAPTRKILSGSVPVAGLLGGEAASKATGASVRTAALQAVDASGPQVVGAMDTGASASGDFTASPLLSSGSWSAGASSGAFTYAYQAQVPETAGGLIPKVALSYSSQSVDGRTSATNNQASWIGDGWDYNPGSITRTYANCREDSKKPGSNNATHRTADLCWGSDNATLSLGGMTTELVWDKTKKTWFTANGDGSKIEQIKNNTSGNGAKDGEYWVVTTRDGTRYHFGRHKLPGWSTGQPVTDSVLTVPVYGNHPDEDCYKAGDWAGSWCTQAWRWGLDYVEDIHGNAMSLWWKRDKNYYARNFNFKAPVAYDRDGYLDHIDYGQRKDSIFSETAPARVGFQVDERCLGEGTLKCTEANFTDKDPGKYRIWYDTPADLRCESGKKCWNAGPSFWSRKRLVSITTSAQRRTDTTARQVVDKYTLTQSFPVLRTGPNTALWLESIQRTGYARLGSTDKSVTLNPVRFESNAEDMPNRVMRPKDPRPGFSRLRVARVINEYGGETVATYKPAVGDCATGTNLPDKKDTAALKANTRLCYPSFWHPDPEVEDIDWFHKYVVDTIEELPNVDGAFSTRTAYSYKNAGWKLAEAEFTKKSTRTYAQFAGFEQTTVLTGENEPTIGSKKSKSVTRYFRGMGDAVSVKDITGAEIAKDSEPFAGRIAEELSYTSASDADTDWLSRSVTVPAATELAKRDRDDGLSPLRAWRVTEPVEIAYTKSSGTGDDKATERVVKTETTYEETYGLPTLVESFGDTGKSGDESCTKLEYVHQTGKNIIGLTKQALVSPTTCAKADFADLTTLSGANRTAYDHQAYGTALADTTRGLATESWSLNGVGTGFQSNGTTDFDAIGRVVKQTDPDNKSSTITYTPSSGQVFEVTETNARGHSQKQELEPGRSTTLKTTDTNGHVSEAKYDPLGRLDEAWAPGRTPSASSVPDFKAVYTIPTYNPENPDRKPPFVTTRTRGFEDRVETSVTLYDGLGRERQTQEEADGGGHLITDTLYNSSGEVWQTNNAYLTHEAEPGQLFTPLADTAVPNITRYTYDGLGRVAEEMPVLKVMDPKTKEATSQPVPERATRYKYGQDWSEVVNPSGTSSYRVYTDALGRTSRVDTYNSAAPDGFTSMRYEYDKRGQLVKAVNSADTTHPWTWTYDHRGRQDSATDPDSGTTRTSYDRFDRPLTTTNARGITVWNGYDELSRPTKQRLNDENGTLLAEFGYDTAPGGKGMPATATRYTDGLAYTQKINGYTKDYQPTSTTLNLPLTLAATWGLATSYTYGYTYNDTGMLEEATLPAVGNFAAEKLVPRYNKDGLPLSISGKDWYGSETVYSSYGQVLRSTLGAQPYRVWAQNSYDESSGELQEQSVYREQTGDKTLVDGSLVSNRSYTYDPAGNVTSIQEHSDGIAERQCFTYDPLGQLKSAWTSKDQTGCAAPKGSDGTLNVTAGKDSSGYWQEYEYDLVGNRKKLTEKDLTGNAAKDATTTYSYGKADGTQPHTLTKVSKTYTTPQGAQVKSEAERLYELTGETKSVTSLQNGDKQDLTWTYDGQVDRISGQGSGGKTPYVGLADKCLDLSSGLAAAGQAIQLYSCNSTVAQSWRFTPTPGTAQADRDRGALSVHDDWCVQPAGNTAGSALKLQKCDGSAGQELKRNASGQLTHVDSNLCLAVKDASSANSTPIVLAVCDGTKPAQLWAPQNDTRHIYGPDGSRLLTIKDKQATLYLGEAEVTVGQDGVLINTQRTYAAPGGAVMRYAAGTGGDALVALTGDHQGSTYAEVALSGSMAVRIRKQDPFGNQRGNGTVGVKLQTHTGFLGATRDDASGYQPLGARLYDPVVGRFLSVDPVLDLNDVLQSNGYAYAHNNPVTMSDPTGLAISLSASERAAALAGAGLSAAQVAQAQAMQGKSLSSVILAVAWETLKDFVGINDALSCFGGDMWSCGSLIIGAIPWTKLGKIPSVMKAVNRTIKAIESFRAAKKAAELVLKAAKAAEAAALKAKKLAIEKAKKEAAQRAKKKAAEAAKRTTDKAVSQTKKTGNPVQKQAQVKAAPKASSSSGGGGGGGKSSGSKPGGNSGGSSRNSGGSSGSGGSGKADGGGTCNSFVPGTKVLMADGSTKPIEEVKTGDKVVATDPETGERRIETVTAEIKGQGLKHLVKVTIDTDGKKGTKTAQVTATDGHPFWVPELGEWIKATDLHSGQWLQTSAGTYVQITAIERWTAQTAAVHNLTVSDLHTYYVLAGASPVLVHNCGDKVWEPFREGVDHADQGTLPTSAGISPGSSLGAGEYHFIVRQDGSLRAMQNESMWDLNPGAGHTSLGDRQGVLMAGTFDVDASGAISRIDNFSGHYRPTNTPGSTSLLDVTRGAFRRHGWDFADNAWDYYAGPPGR